MTLQPPKALAPEKGNDNPLNAALEHEILAEKAATYGRLLKRLEEALAELREAEAVEGVEAVDIAHGDSSPSGLGPARARPNGRRPFGLASPDVIADAMPAGSDALPNGQGTANNHDAQTDAVTGAKKSERPPTGREARPNGRRPVRAPSRRPVRAADGTAVSDKNKTAEHDDLLSAAGEALWHVIIQRDLCGFRNHQDFMDELDVPAAVRFRMGPARTK